MLHTKRTNIRFEEFCDSPILRTYSDNHNKK